MAMALFHSWPWPHSIHGHGAFHSWPRPPIMAKVLSLSHHTNAPGQTSPCIRCRIARASPPRRFRANRLNPGIKSYWRQGWFRGVAAVDRGDYGTSCIRICIGHKWGYARIYGGKNGHVCAYLWQQQWPCMRISMGHECAYLWQQQWPYMRISMGHECAYLWGHVYAYIYSSSNGHINK